MPASFVSTTTNLYLKILDFSRTSMETKTDSEFLRAILLPDAVSLEVRPSRAMIVDEALRI